MSIKTYTYKVNPGQPTEFLFSFDARTRAEADEYCKQRTKRGSKSEFVKTTPTNFRQGPDRGLQHIPQRNHSSKESEQNYTLVFECPECGHQWSHSNVSSHMFKERCPNRQFEHSYVVIDGVLPKDSDPVTYTYSLYKHVQLPAYDMDGSVFHEGRG